MTHRQPKPAANLVKPSVPANRRHADCYVHYLPLTPTLSTRSEEIPMFRLPEQFSATSKYQFETQMKVINACTFKALESTQKIIALSLNVGKTTLESSTIAAKHLLSAKDAHDFFTRGVSEARPAIDSLLSYGREVANIIASAQNEILHAVKEDVAQVKSAIMDNIRKTPAATTKPAAAPVVQTTAVAVVTPTAKPTAKPALKVNPVKAAAKPAVKAAADKVAVTPAKAKLVKKAIAAKPIVAPVPAPVVAAVTVAEPVAEPVEQAAATIIDAEVETAIAAANVAVTDTPPQIKRPPMPQPPAQAIKSVKAKAK
jgi:phasin family protein